MNRGLNTLVGAQFLSAFGDNAILFTVIAMSLQTGGRGAWYIPALQSAFLVAYVTLTP
jgi:MFS transporter, LPLT family, lysophospholipid transporter